MDLTPVGHDLVLASPSAGTHTSPVQVALNGNTSEPEHDRGTLARTDGEYNTSSSEAVPGRRTLIAHGDAPLTDATHTISLRALALKDSASSDEAGSSLISQPSTPTLEVTIAEEDRATFASQLASLLNNWVVIPFFSGCSSVTKLTRRYFVEGNHPWKQQKYRLCMQETVRALNDKVASLHDHCASADIRSEEATSLVETLIAYFDAERSVRDLTEEEHAAYGCLYLLTHPEDHANARSQYLAFMTSLRMGLATETFSAAATSLHFDRNAKLSTATEVLLAICEARFAHVNIYTFLSRLVDFIINAGREVLAEESEDGILVEADVENPRAVKEIDFEAIAHIPPELGAVRSAVLLGMFKGTVSMGFDPQFQVNAPYVLHTTETVGADGTHRPVTCFRMGTPTMQGITTTEIIPEFDAFLLTLLRAGHRHLYVSLQNHIPKGYGIVGDETARNKAIIALAEHYPETFVPIVLSQDSAWYKQRGERFAVEFMAYDEFRETTREYMFERADKGFYFPPALVRDRAFTRQALELLDTLKTALFEDRPELTVRERQDLIEVYQAALILFTVKHLNADSYNVTCKDAIDRAGKTSAAILQIIAILQGREDDADHHEQIRTHTHAAAWWVKKQPILHSRRERLLHALELLLGDGVADRLRSGLAAYDLVDGAQPVMEQRPDQDIIPPIAAEEVPPIVALVQEQDDLLADLFRLADVAEGQKLGTYGGRLYTSSGTTSGWWRPVQAIQRWWYGESRTKTAEHLSALADRLTGAIAAQREYVTSVIETGDHSDLHGLRQGLFDLIHVLRHAAAGIERLHLNYRIPRPESPPPAGAVSADGEAGSVEASSSDESDSSEQEHALSEMLAVARRITEEQIPAITQHIKALSAPIARAILNNQPLRPARQEASAEAVLGDIPLSNVPLAVEDVVNVAIPKDVIKRLASFFWHHPGGTNRDGGYGNPQRNREAVQRFLLAVVKPMLPEDLKGWLPSKSRARELVFELVLRTMNIDALMPPYLVVHALLDTEKVTARQVLEDGAHFKLSSEGDTLTIDAFLPIELKSADPDFAWPEEDAERRAYLGVMQTVRVNLSELLALSEASRCSTDEVLAAPSVVHVTHTMTERYGSQEALIAAEAPWTA